MDVIFPHPDEQGLVARIQQNFADDAPKLVYADWLEERDDPRGAYLRAWVFLRRRSAKSSDYEILQRHQDLGNREWAYRLGLPHTHALIRQYCNIETLDRLTNLFRPGFWVVDGEYEETDIPVGASKRGGYPDLLPSQRWPVYDQAPMQFLMQINLAEIAAHPCAGLLPTEGVLSFFAQASQGVPPPQRFMGLVEHQTNVSPYPDVPVACCYSPNVSRLEPRPNPRQISEEYWRQREVRLNFESAVFTPPLFQLDEPDQVLISRVQEQIRPFYLGRDIDTASRLMGHAIDRYDLAPMKKRYLLLGGVFPIGVQLRNSYLEFWIPPNDLKELRFDRVLGIVPYDPVG